MKTAMRNGRRSASDGWTLVPAKKMSRRRLTSPKVNGASERRYVEIDGEAWQLAADGARYKQVGNSMAVPVIAWIGRRIDAALVPLVGVDRA